MGTICKPKCVVRLLGPLALRAKLQFVQRLSGAQFQRSLLCSATLLLSSQTALLVLLIDALRPTGTAVAFIVGRREEACEPLSSIAFVAEIFDGCTSRC